jgi:hypothetical protein
LSKEYLLSLPERVIRSVVGLGAGLVREVGDVVIPKSVRRTQLYQNLVDTTLRFLIEQVGGVGGAYPAGDKLADDFLVRRTAGNVLELMGVIAFRASPVWVLAALADVAGAGRSLIPEIADELKSHGLLEKEAEFTTVDQMLDGLERTSSRLANAVNTPPLDVASLRKEWAALRDDAASLAPASLPSRDAIKDVWNQLKSESTAQKRSVFEMSSVLALTAAGKIPDTVRWWSMSAKAAASRTGQILGASLLDYYRATLDEIRNVGFAAYASRQLKPYLRAAVGQFYPERRTLTERIIDKWRKTETRE